MLSPTLCFPTPTPCVNRGFSRACNVKYLTWTVPNSTNYFQEKPYTTAAASHKDPKGLLCCHLVYLVRPEHNSWPNIRFQFCLLSPTPLSPINVPHKLGKDVTRISNSLWTGVNRNIGI